MMGSLKGRTTYRTTAPPVVGVQRHYGGCVVVLAITIVLAGILYYRMRPTETSTSSVESQAIVVPTPIAVSTPAQSVCTVINDECGSMAMPSQHHSITEYERAALAVIHRASGPIPDGVNSACYWANKFGVTCADVESATKQMEGWHVR